jgi:hypothetical protein
MALYRHHIYGIMGTLVFHILLLLIFLITGISQKIQIREDAIEIEIPVELIKQVEELQSVLQKLDGKNPNIPQSGEMANGGMTNLPSNRGFLSNRDPFFDEGYEKEVSDAKKLVSDVNDQLSREIVDINSVEMPEDVTEGKTAEEIKNTIYSGESNIEYHLDNRYHLRLPIPVYLAKGGGVVTVDIMVSRDGRVVSAKPRSNSTTTDEQIYLYSKIAAQRTVFNADQSAPAVQSGTIRYTFIAQ